jgi:hypothetical protein
LYDPKANEQHRAKGRRSEFIEAETAMVIKELLDKQIELVKAGRPFRPDCWDVAKTARLAGATTGST